MNRELAQRFSTLKREDLERRRDEMIELAARHYQLGREFTGHAATFTEALRLQEETNEKR